MTMPPPTRYVAPALNPDSITPDQPKQLNEEQFNAIVHQLVFPFGPEGKVEPAIHIHATADGYCKVYQAIAEAMRPDGPLSGMTNIIEDAIAKRMPELTGLAAQQSAKSYVINRRNQALGVAEAFAPESKLVQTAIEYSARLINKEIQPDQVPTGGHTVLGVIDDKQSRLEAYANHSLAIPRETNATHVAAFASGHIPMHQTLADIFTIDSPVAKAIANQILLDVPELTPEQALQTAAGYLEYGHGMAAYDVEHLPEIADRVLSDRHAGYEPALSSIATMPTVEIDGTSAQSVGQAARSTLADPLVR